MRINFCWIDMHCKVNEMSRPTNPLPSQKAVFTLCLFLPMRLLSVPLPCLPFFCWLIFACSPPTHCPQPIDFFLLHCHDDWEEEEVKLAAYLLKQVRCPLALFLVVVIFFDTLVQRQQGGLGVELIHGPCPVFGWQHMAAFAIFGPPTWGFFLMPPPLPMSGPLPLTMIIPCPLP